VVRTRQAAAEWPTIGLLAACYALWALATTALAAASLPLAIGLAAVAIAFHSSLTHEAVHGHPFRVPLLNAAAVFPALGLFVPYGRFRDQHLAHHHDPIITDPYDDPESNYLDPATWHRLPVPLRALLRANNTLLGRMVLGPAIGLTVFVGRDLHAFARGDRAVARAWAWHLPALVPVALWLGLVAAMPVWAYLLAAYAGMGLLKIRTFLEHRAHEKARARTVIIEDRGPLALLFLNNNLHVVHHMHPRAPWYRLPALYRANRDTYLARNDGYIFRSYAEVFGRFLWRAKDPVAHPLYRPGEPGST
jgi:fatty acid desaturase